MCESCVGAAQLCRAFCLRAWPWSGMAQCAVCVCCLLCAFWGILLGCLVVFGCWWFEWLKAVRAVEIPSPVFSLGCPVGNPVGFLVWC